MTNCDSRGEKQWVSWKNTIFIQLTYASIMLSENSTELWAEAAVQFKEHNVIQLPHACTTFQYEYASEREERDRE